MNPKRNGSAAAILKARAETLAREPEKKQDVVHLDVIPFQLASESYAIEARILEEVHPLTELTPLPGTPAFVLGILNVRGHILPVLDLNRFFDLPGPTGFSEPSKIVRIQVNDIQLGLLANSADEIRSIALHTIQTAPPASMGLRTECLKGVTSEGVLLLDMEKILLSDKMTAMDAETDTSA